MAKSMANDSIVVLGARENNLKNLSLQIQKNKITVITGPSGSGKSSLAFDTIHAESQWRFIESLSLSTRLFLNKLPRPLVGGISGLNPSISLKQGLVSAAGRTVGSFAEINHLIANLFVQYAVAYCPSCGAVLKTSTVQSIVDELSSLTTGTKLEVMSPLALTEYDQLIKLRESGIVRLKIENQDYRLDEELEDIPLSNGYIVYDRLKLGGTSRIYDSIESAMKLGSGKVAVLIDSEKLFNFQDFARCEECKIDVPEIKTQFFNNLDSQEGNYFKINNLTFSEVLNTKLNDLNDLLDSLSLPVENIKSRVLLLNEMDLNQLSLSRSLDTLSNGQIQKLRLASLFAAELTGVSYILDEPSAFLGLSGVKKILNLINRFKENGNTLIIVDHHPEIIKSADYIIEMGPASGSLGGTIIAQGSIKEVFKNKQSQTYKYFSKPKKLPEVRQIEKEKLEIILNDNAKLTIPGGALTTICGDSGAGKTRLLFDQIIPAVSGFTSNYNGPKYSRVINLESGYSSKTIRSNPASLLDVFSSIRELFAGVADSKIRGFGPSRFSFNTKGGRCEDCQGTGLKKLDLDLLSDVFAKCSTCNGKRYNRDTLSVKYKGLNINEVLELSIAEAANFFRQIPDIYSRLTLACDVGVSYLSLGQSANSISGGEYQRLKVAEALNSNSQALFVLDEPCLGLYASDLESLIKLLNRITSKGNSVIVATQNLDLILSSQHIVKLSQNNIIFSGTRDKFINSKESEDFAVKNYYTV